MRVEISFPGDDGKDLIGSLHRWLAMEDDLRGNVKIDGAAGSDSLGPGADILTVAIGGGGAATVLISSIGTWLRQPKKSDVIIKVTSEGKSVEIDAKRVTATEAQELLRNALESDQG